MSFDGFETRLEFSKLLRTLSASQQSIQIVVSYALKYASRCADDLWDVIMEQCGKTTLNMRINVLYFIDSLCDPMLSVVVPSKSSSAATTAANPFPALLARHFQQIIDLVVPPEKEGVLNLLSTKQIVESWRARRIAPPEQCEKILHQLEERRLNPRKADEIGSSTATAPRKRPRYSLANFSRSDTLRRMEEDRERHKRLRERMWVVPMPRGPLAGNLGPAASTRPKVSHMFSPGSSSPSTGPSPFTPVSPSFNQALTAAGPSVTTSDHDGLSAGGEAVQETGALQVVDVEFEQAWEDGSDLGEDDLDDFVEESIRAGVPLSVRPTLEAIRAQALERILPDEPAVAQDGTS